MVRTKQTAKKTAPSVGKRMRLETKRKSIQKKQVSSVEKVKKRRFKNGMRALQQIRMLQRTTSLLIPKAPFQRLVREIAMKTSSDATELRFQSAAISALQEAAEAYMTCFFEDTNLAAIHAHRVTIFPKDMHLIQRLRRQK
ncbi:hypothetical protein AB6A40_009722 [Gnathostoma spinigerum]|uniref:Core Histone H2A/H2B/H3 domain-containing protein n=1 Tax=Gnathostoma spinigerum TaxID=75299 RepID=A0ABD6ET63_9BILA